MNAILFSKVNAGKIELWTGFPPNGKLVISSNDPIALAEALNEVGIAGNFLHHEDLYPDAPDYVKHPVTDKIWGKTWDIYMSLPSPAVR